MPDKRKPVIYFNQPILLFNANDFVLFAAIFLRTRVREQIISRYLLYTSLLLDWNVKMAWTEVSAVLHFIFTIFRTLTEWLWKFSVYFMYAGILIIHWKIWKIFFWLQKQKIVSTKTVHFILDKTEITFEPCKNAKHL